MFLAFALLASLTAHAVDTSGCSQLITEGRQVNRPNGAVLSATYVHPNRADCWNASSAKLSVTYSFPSRSASPAVSFWTSLNGQARQVAPSRLECRADVTYRVNNEAPKICRGCGDVNAGDQPASLTCYASFTFQNGAGRQDLEVAPSVNGQFDTDGYGQNLRLTF